MPGKRRYPQTLPRILRNRAHHRAAATIVARHRGEYEQEFDLELGRARREAEQLAAEAANAEVFDGETVRLKPGARPADAPDTPVVNINWCGVCQRYHADGHVPAAPLSVTAHLAASPSPPNLRQPTPELGVPAATEPTSITVFPPIYAEPKTSIQVAPRSRDEMIVGTYTPPQLSSTLNDADFATLAARLLDEGHKEPTITARLMMPLAAAARRLHRIGEVELADDLLAVRR